MCPGSRGRKRDTTRGILTIQVRFKEAKHEGPGGGGVVEVRRGGGEGV